MRYTHESGDGDCRNQDGFKTFKGLFKKLMPPSELSMKEMRRAFTNRRTQTHLHVTGKIASMRGHITTVTALEAVFLGHRSARGPLHRTSPQTPSGSVRDCVCPASEAELRRRQPRCVFVRANGSGQEHFKVANEHTRERWGVRMALRHCT